MGSEMCIRDRGTTLQHPAPRAASGRRACRGLQPSTRLSRRVGDAARGLPLQAHGRPEGYRDASPGAPRWVGRAPRPAVTVPTRRDLLRHSAPREESGERRVGGVFRGVNSSTVISKTVFFGFVPVRSTARDVASLPDGVCRLPSVLHAASFIFWSSIDASEERRGARDAASTERTQASRLHRSVTAAQH